MSNFKLALIQLAVSSSKADNLLRVAARVKEAAENGAKIIALPECFNSPYGVNYFKEYAEPIPKGGSAMALSSLAKEHNVCIIGGSIPELGEDKKLYNSCSIWAPGSGLLLGIHRKLHLFDIDVPGRITFKESSVLTSGNKFTCVQTEFCKIGVGICYDLRFPELAQFYRESGCDLLIYPGAFNMTTGPAHWQILQQARAVDNQVYVATVSPARDESASYVAYGNSMVVNPWGEVQARADGSETIIYADIDLNRIKEVRAQIPVGQQKRADLYKTNFFENQS